MPRLAWPFVSPLILPLVTAEAIGLTSNIIAIGGLAGSAISAALFWKKTHARKQRIEKRLDKTARMIEKILSAKDQPETENNKLQGKMTSLAFIMQSIYAAAGEIVIKKEPPPARLRTPHKPEEIKNVPIHNTPPATETNFSPPLAAPWVPDNSPLQEAMRFPGLGSSPG